MGYSSYNLSLRHSLTHSVKQGLRLRKENLKRAQHSRDCEQRKSSHESCSFSLQNAVSENRKENSFRRVGIRCPCLLCGLTSSHLAGFFAHIEPLPCTFPPSWILACKSGDRDVAPCGGFSHIFCPRSSGHHFRTASSASCESMYSYDLGSLTTKA